MYNKSIADAHADWLADFDRIRAGNLTEIERECYAGPGKIPLAEWLSDDGMPPDPRYYRPWRDDEATWFQVWETVSEGSPVSPAFATREELVEYLVKHGDFWAQKRRERPPSRSAVEAFVLGDGWVPSMVVVSNDQGSQTATGIGAMDLLRK